MPISIAVVSSAIIFLQHYYKAKESGNVHRESLGSSIHKAIVYLVAGEGNYSYSKISFVQNLLSLTLFKNKLGDWNGYSQLAFRLVQGDWCLAAFVLFNAYCSTLISYLISPRLMPIAKSWDDVASGNPQQLRMATEKSELVAHEFLVSFYLKSSFTN